MSSRRYRERPRQAYDEPQPEPQRGTPGRWTYTGKLSLSRKAAGERRPLRRSRAVGSGLHISRRASPRLMRDMEQINQNPTDLTGDRATEHRDPTAGDLVNGSAPTAAQRSAHTANVKVIASESNPYKLEMGDDAAAPPAPDVKRIYEESGQQQSPPPSGFITVTELNGTVDAPIVEEPDLDKGIYRGKGPTADDVQQGGIGNCFMMSTTMSVAQRDPGKITSMMTPDGNGGAGVTLYRKNTDKSFWEWMQGSSTDWTPVSIHASSDLAAHKGGGIRGAQLHGGQPKSSAYWAKIAGQAMEVHRKDTLQVARWVALLEKAYASFAEKYGYDGTGANNKKGASGYDQINGGYSHAMMPVFYGSEAADARQSAWKWQPNEGNNFLTRNPAVVDKLLLLAGRGEAPSGADAPIVTAQTDPNFCITRLGDVIPVARADAGWAAVTAPRQQQVTDVQTAITAWTGAAAADKDAKKKAIGTACQKATQTEPRPSLENFEAIKQAMPATVPFEKDQTVVAGPPLDALLKFGDKLRSTQNPATKVKIVGHASSEGKDDHNKMVSEQRAMNARFCIEATDVVDPHTIETSGVGEEGADKSAGWRRADLSIEMTPKPTNELLGVKEGPIKQMADLMLDCNRLDTDNAPGQRNVYAIHAYSVMAVAFLDAGGAAVSLAGDKRQENLGKVSMTKSWVKLRNPHHKNAPDRYGDKKATDADEKSGIFTMSLDEFVTNFAAVDAAVVPRS